MQKANIDVKLFAARFSELLHESSENTYTLAKKLGLAAATISRYANGLMAPKLPTLRAIAEIFDVDPDWLAGDDVPKERSTPGRWAKFPAPNVTDAFVTFPVIGEIAAGYDSVALEDAVGETIDIPTSFLRGREKSDFFVLKVKGDSMYPTYQDGDRVLILKQATLDHSGQIGAVLYEDDLATLKRVEYVDGEDWMRLVPVNPAVPPTRIEGEKLEHCRILGVPRLLIREV